MLRIASYGESFVHSSIFSVFSLFFFPLERWIEGSREIGFAVRHFHTWHLSTCRERCSKGKFFQFLGGLGSLRG